MATALVAQPVAQHWPEVKRQLEKKATFEQAVQQCLDALAAGQPVPQDLARRAMTLLRSRFSSPAFWHKGRALFEAAAAAAADDVARRELRAYVEQCSEFLGDAPGPSAEQQQPAEQQAARQQQQRYLFEGQLGSGAGEPAAPEPGVRLMGLLAQQLMGAAAEGGSEGHPPQPPSAEVLEAMQQELDAIAVQIMEETAGQQPPPGGPPPASKQAVRQLPVEALTAERLQELGGAEARCAVCMEELREGSEVQAMPCKHAFHPNCLKPWLLEHRNTCPTCRHELPTDNPQYERRKERERVEAEERRGVENAVSHNEFLYI